MALRIRSPAFEDRGDIPARYTCEGEDVSAPLEWSGVPDGTASLALIVDDPDAPDPRAPQRTWVHWVVFDIAPTVRAVPEGAGSGGAARVGRDGLNDWGRPGWGGPCPPVGRHRYFFKLYALDTTLDDLERPTKAELEQAMAGHVLEQAELVGMYEKKR
ncbi:MAG TPA: YbhB/YbcL family Raf kinase inhibitor-like protein [Longimicrobiales bacterium]|nr:YbhB/YbcL family Raf kinase inhibitor-like protein [Longimicrobiales bacterium]